MKTYSNSFTPESYLKHKEHFDNRIIKQIECNETKIKSPRELIETRKYYSKKRKFSIKALKSKIEISRS